MLSFFTDMAHNETLTLSLHDALPISIATGQFGMLQRADGGFQAASYFVRRSAGSEGGGSADSNGDFAGVDRKSTRLNSSHEWISYAVFCLKKKSIQPAAFNNLYDAED